MNINFNISKRTKILACVAAALAVVCAAQFLLGLRSPQKTFKLKGAPDYISVENLGNATILQKNDADEWLCETELLDTNKVEVLLSSVNPLKTLGVTSRSASEATLERYGLDKPIVLRIRSKDKPLLSILIGKDSASGSQSYVQLEGKKEIYLTRGNLRTAWEIKVDMLKPDPKPEPAPESENSQGQEEAADSGEAGKTI